MNVGGRAGGQAGGLAGVNNMFLEHNSATVIDILIGLGRIIEQVNAECCIQE